MFDATMERAPLARKRPVQLRIAPNAAPGAEDARGALPSLPDGGFNLAYAAVDRHAAGPDAGRTAFRFLHPGGSQRSVSYGELSQLSNRLCRVLRRLHVGKGDRVFALCGRIPELYIAMLGALKNGSVAAPLPSGLGAVAAATRLALGSARVLVTTESIYRRRIEPQRARLPLLEHVLLVSEDGVPTRVPRTWDLATLMADEDDDCAIERTTADDPALLHFASDTTGRPKGTLHLHGAAAAAYAAGRRALDLRPGDVVWCTGEPGRAAGTVRGVLAPLLHGATGVVDGAEFYAERCYWILQEQEVTVWCAAPAAVRMLMKAGPELARRYHFAQLRVVAGIGEPLSAAAAQWALDALGLPIRHDLEHAET